MLFGSGRSRSCCEIDSWLVLRVSKAADVTNALPDVRHAVFPIAFVFDRDVSVEFLPAQLAENSFHVGDTQAERNIARVGIPGLDDVLQMHADDSTLEDFQPVHCVDTRTCPVSNVGTDAE